MDHNPMLIEDALDFDRSDILRFSDGRIMEITRRVFNMERSVTATRSRSRCAVAYPLDAIGCDAVKERFN